jgi:hypothetical protein
MTRKGQIITLKTPLLLDLFKGCAVGEDWIVISGGAITVAAPVDQSHSQSHTDALCMDKKDFNHYFEATDRKGAVPTGVISRHTFAYQWNDAIRTLNA